MFSALWWKEWRQLRMLRWSGFGIGLFLPPFLLAMAEAGKRGWTVLGNISSYDAATVVQEAMPMFLALAVWPLLALMTAAQAFAADRAAGTEAFLLERPVRRSRVWQARAVAAISSTWLLVVGHLAVWWVCVRLLGNPAGFDELATFSRMVAQGTLFSGIAIFAGAAAAAFVRSPMQATLLGLVFAAIPVALANLLGFWYVGYSLGKVSLGFGIPLFLLVGYLVGSFRMQCRGEPAGQGRVRRGLAVLATAFVAMPVFLASTAPIVMRWDARLGLGNTAVYPAPSGSLAIVLNNRQRAAWLIDTVSGERLRFFAPPVSDVAWNADGDRLAMIHSAGGSGRRLPAPRIEVFDTAGARAGRSIVCDACLGWWNDSGLIWAGDRIVTLGFVEGRTGVMIFDPGTGERKTVPVPQGPTANQALLEAPQAGRAFLARLVRDPDEKERKSRKLLLHSIDIAGAKLGEPVRIPRVNSLYYADRSLSPSGTQWLRFPYDAGDQLEIFDVATGESRTIPTRTAEWLSGDRLVWVEKDGSDRRLMLGHPHDARELRSFPSAWTWFRTAPDRQRLLIANRLPGEPPRIDQWVYEIETDRWQDIRRPHEDPNAWFGSAQWAGAGALAFVGQGYLALQHLERPEEFEYVLGGPGS